ncbi:MAG: histidine phosphatase family protein [Bacteroidales bacterium]|nr:histidine phosphatase family protein [Bacteroidales bacterium]
MRILFILLQLALGVFEKNPELSAGNLYAYSPLDTLVSKAPAGYKPFYISHMARHGSRYLSKEREFYVVDTLAAWADAGLLAPDGLELLEDLRMFRSITEGRLGALTALGAAEHRQISSRMLRHYPEVFSDRNRRHVDAYSTESKRVMASRSSFISEMWRRVPEMEVSLYDAKTNPEVWVNVRGEKMSYSQQKKLRRAFDRRCEKLPGYNTGCTYTAFASRILKDPSSVSQKRIDWMAENSFKLFKTGRTTNPDTMPSMGKYFSAEELYALWLPGCYRWGRYIDFKDCKSSFLKPYGGEILKCLIGDADEALGEDSHTAATIRFSHDTYLMPFMSAIGFEETVPGISLAELPERFPDYRIICPGCNVQFIFYRGDGPVLVKLLLNEKESRVVGLEPVQGCYYSWDALKEYFKRRLR